MEGAFVTISSYANPKRANEGADILKSAGIPCRVHLGDPDISSIFSTDESRQPFLLQVYEADVDEAFQILQQESLYEEELPPESAEDKLVRGRRNMVIGGILGATGLAVALSPVGKAFSLVAAAGALLLGGLQFVQGLHQVDEAEDQLGEDYWEDDFDDDPF
ncbi:MAG: hypothetical protein AAGI38_21530 [Bacteroidota bacterium]